VPQRSLGIGLERPIGQEVVNRRATLPSNQMPAQRLRPGNHLVQCPQRRHEDGSARLELHGVTADRRASLITGLVRMLDILIETEKGFTVKPFAKSQRIAA
jgi:hypothetical protein